MSVVSQGDLFAASLKDCLTSVAENLLGGWASPVAPSLVPGKSL